MVCVVGQWIIIIIVVLRLWANGQNGQNGQNGRAYLQLSIRAKLNYYFFLLRKKESCI